MKNRAFSYLELIIAMTLVVIVVILSAPLMTSMGKKPTPIFGEYKCYARLVNGNWKLYQNERINSDLYSEDDKEVAACTFSRPVGNVSSYTVTLYGGGGSGSMPYYSSSTSETIEFAPGGDGKAGETKSVVDTLEKAFDSDGTMKIYFCDDSTHLNAKNCVGKGGKVNTQESSVEYSERIEEIRNSKTINASDLSFMLQSCADESGLCSKDNLLFNVECLRYNVAGGKDAYIATCAKTCTQEKTTVQVIEDDISQKCIDQINQKQRCIDSLIKSYGTTRITNSKRQKIQNQCESSSGYNACVEQNVKYKTVWNEKCPDVSECTSKYNNLAVQCSTSQDTHLKNIKGCVSEEKCDTDDVTKITGYSGKFTKIILSSSISFVASGGLYGISDKYSPKKVQPDSSIQIYFSPDYKTPVISGKNCSNCNGEDANNPSDTDTYENYGAGGGAGIFACKLNRGAAKLAGENNCFKGRGGSGAGGAIIIQWN